MNCQDLEVLKQKNGLHFWYHGRNELLRRILKYNLQTTDLAIINLGCGTGQEMEILSPYGQVTGVDISPQALAEVAEQGFELIQADLNLLPWNFRLGDVITAFDLIEHLENDRLFLTSAYNHLKPGGIFIFTVPNCRLIYSTHDLNTGHKKRYDKKTIVSLLQQAGFRDREIYYWNTLLFAPIFTFRLIKKILYGLNIIRTAKSDVAFNFPLMNSLLQHLLAWESKFFFRNKYLPGGLTIYGWAKKI